MGPRPGVGLTRGDGEIPLNAAALSEQFLRLGKAVGGELRRPGYEALQLALGAPWRAVIRSEGDLLAVGADRDPARRRLAALIDQALDLLDIDKAAGGGAYQAHGGGPRVGSTVI